MKSLTDQGLFYDYTLLLTYFLLTFVFDHDMPRLLNIDIDSRMV
ncbi:MAG: hypothetical protein PHE73_00585 [Sulfurovaceae bacterium]|nr:hypothetical protein [Sulfurovaceae bacterium]